MDGAAGLGIYGAAHARLDELASRAQVVYKPCGAGGGDIGIAVSDDASSLDSLTTLAARESFPSLTLEIAAHGVHRISS
jgi:phosphomevalonate kinase